MMLVITLLVVGALLLLAETVLPGLVAGTLGIGCLVAGVFLAYAEFGAGTGNMVLLSVVIGLVVGFLLWLKYFPDSRIARPFVSQGISGELGTERPELINQIGKAYTTLRPAGVAEIMGHRVDVVTEGAMISKGSTIKVIRVEGARVVVRAL